MLRLTSPIWGTDTFCPRSYKIQLDILQVDDLAQQELFCLSQRCPAGRVAADDILARLLKMYTEGRDVANPSAWCHSADWNARHLLP